MKADEARALYNEPQPTKLNFFDRLYVKWVLRGIYLEIRKATAQGLRYIIMLGIADDTKLIPKIIQDDLRSNGYTVEVISSMLMYTKISWETEEQRIKRRVDELARDNKSFDNAVNFMATKGLGEFGDINDFGVMTMAKECGADSEEEPQGKENE